MAAGLTPADSPGLLAEREEGATPARPHVGPSLTWEALRHTLLPCTVMLSMVAGPCGPCSWSARAGAHGLGDTLGRAPGGWGHTRDQSASPLTWVTIFCNHPLSLLFSTIGTETAVSALNLQT